MPDASVPLTPGSSPRSLTSAELAAIRRSRRRPRRTQFDYLHVQCLVRDLGLALGRLPGSVRDVLDVWCGSRPYEDLFPRGARVVGLDVEGNPYGVADIVSNEILPFDDSSFDLVVCIEAFQWMREPQRAVAEFRRVLRPGGTALVAVPYAFEYDRANFERRFTGNELLELFDGWDDVALAENGGRAVAWAVLTASLVSHAATRAGVPGLERSAGIVHALVNVAGAGLDRLERRYAGGTVAFPMNLLVTARRPA